MNTYPTESAAGLREGVFFIPREICTFNFKLRSYLIYSLSASNNTRYNSNLAPKLGEYNKRNKLFISLGAISIIFFPQALEASWHFKYIENDLLKRPLLKVFSSGVVTIQVCREPQALFEKNFWLTAYIPGHDACGIKHKIQMIYIAHIGQSKYM